MYEIKELQERKISGKNKMRLDFGKSPIWVQMPQ